VKAFAKEFEQDDEDGQMEDEEEGNGMINV
jgi:hypothetical protein